MAKYFYQQTDNIGKEIAVVKSYVEIKDTKHYRAVTEEYYNAVIDFLKEQASEQGE